MSHRWPPIGERTLPHVVLAHEQGVREVGGHPWRAVGAAAAALGIWRGAAVAGQSGESHVRLAHAEHLHVVLEKEAGTLGRVEHDERLVALCALHLTAAHEQRSHQLVVGHKRTHHRTTIAASAFDELDKRAQLNGRRTSRQYGAVDEAAEAARALRVELRAVGGERQRVHGQLHVSGRVELVLVLL